MKSFLKRLDPSINGLFYENSPFATFFDWRYSSTDPDEEVLQTAEDIISLESEIKHDYLLWSIIDAIAHTEGEDCRLVAPNIYESNSYKMYKDCSLEVFMKHENIKFAATDNEPVDLIVYLKEEDKYLIVEVYSGSDRAFKEVVAKKYNPLVEEMKRAKKKCSFRLFTPKRYDAFELTSGADSDTIAAYQRQMSMLGMRIDYWKKCIAVGKIIKTKSEPFRMDYAKQKVGDLLALLIVLCILVTLPLLFFAFVVLVIVKHSYARDFIQHSYHSLTSQLRSNYVLRLRTCNTTEAKNMQQPFVY